VPDLDQVIADTSDDREAFAVLRQMSLPEVDVRLPGADALLTEFLLIAVPFADLNPLIAVAARLREPDGQDLLRLLTGGLAVAMGRPGAAPRLPAVAPSFVDPPGYVHLFAALLVLPHVRRYHGEHGVDPLISWRTLADVGRNVAIYRDRHGAAGFDDMNWVRLHLTGCLYDLGRLQFERARLGTTFARLMREDGLDVEPGQPVISVHIPRYAGPLHPKLVDEAFERARAFFPDRFDERPRYFVCYSWLLDPLLADHLPARSNILNFQRRFTVSRADQPDDSSTLLFVYGNPDLPRSSYPRGTSLERGIMAHLDAGEHWHGGRGWLPL
jgi:GNAT-like C-terminal domain/N-acyltransferase N-terminal domain